MAVSLSSGLTVLGFMLGCVAFSCTPDSGPVPPDTDERLQQGMKFVLMDQAATGVRFANEVRPNNAYNHFSFEYVYNGGGVAVGDVNGDDLPDLYFSASIGNNKLYLNQGNLKFKDVTQLCQVQAASGFKTGVTMADVNGDGLLDIHCCRTSSSDDGLKSDLLYINQGNQEHQGLKVPVFLEQAGKLGLDDNSNTNHACYFDFDRDGDLDVFLVNHRLNFREANKMRVRKNVDGTLERHAEPQSPFESNRLYRNDNGRFVDITRKTGMTSSAHGLSATIADINQDGWMDVYVANDYVEPDFLYINNKDGTFTDQYATYLKHSCLTSMGSDVADINNDGLVDIMVLDMKPEDHVRYKMLAQNDFERYNLMVQSKYGRQAGRNVLQLNNGNQTFSDIGQFAGVSATDWSWGVLLVDFDNDGWKDIYISNGYRKDVTQLDYLNYTLDSLSRAIERGEGKPVDINSIMRNLPETKVAGYLYNNNRNLQFTDVTKAAGMEQRSFKNGCVYSDLDLDGDLDIVVNNIDQPAFIYRNESPTQQWLQLDLIGKDGNTNAIGGFAYVHAKGMKQHVNMITNRGFFSSSEPILHFGLGDATTADSVVVHWPDGTIELKKNVRANQRIRWKQGDEPTIPSMPASSPAPLFARHPGMVSWRHADNDHVDFKQERLIPYYLSAEGPCLATGDVNGDGLTDVFAGNGRDAAAAILLQGNSGVFTISQQPALQADKSFEDTGAEFTDIDSDSDLDLLVIAGGHDLPDGDASYSVRCYLNDGKGTFTRDNAFPALQSAAGSLLVFDYDNDNDPDLFIGGRSVPGRFPLAPASYVLRMDNGKFSNVTKDVFPEFSQLGMLTDLQQADLDGDNQGEIVISGDWMPLRIFSFDGKKFIDKGKSLGIPDAPGWWKSVMLTDIDQDGDNDLLAGNIGTNHRMKASAEFPLTLVYNDFDGNGSIDPIMCYYHDGRLYPYAQRDAIIGQIPVLKKKFTRYSTYARATLEDVFSKEQLSDSKYLYTHTFESVLFRNDKGTLVPSPLPYQVQLHPVYDMLTLDVNQDGNMDLVMAGNFSYSETETGELDAGNGTVLIQQANGSFSYVTNREHGFWAQGEVRELRLVPLANGQRAIMTGNNRGPIEVSVLTR